MFLSRQLSRDDTADYRAMVATAVASICCAIGLVVLTLLLIAGDRFEFRPPPEAVRFDDNLVQSFEALDRMSARTAGATADGALTTPRQDAKPADLGIVPVEPSRRRTVTRLKSPWCTGVLAHQPFHSCKPRPK